jgi:RNA polymerase sigma-70 factor (ECF subfamily)
MTTYGDTSVHLRAALGGDDESLGWLVRHLSPLLLAQARWRLGAQLAHACEPEDLVQEAWLATLPRLRELHSQGGRTTPVLLRFLSSCIVHRVNNLARAALRGGPATPTPVTALPASQTGAVTAAMRAEQHRALLDAIDELEPVDREVLLLRAVEQRPQQTTGELLGISGDAVAMRLSRALRRLRAQLPEALARDLGA